MCKIDLSYGNVTLFMPIGDPCGGNFSYIDEGLPETIFMVTVPCKDIKLGIAFYRDMLGMSLLYEKDTEAVIRRNGTTIMLRRSEDVGRDTGIYLGVDNPYDLHRRLVDEGVQFIKDPMREPMGVCTSFRDQDGNLIYAIEMKAEIKP